MLACAKAALITFVWPFFTVYLHMFLQIVCLMGCVTTLITFVGSFSSPSPMLNHMFIQICSMWRSKLTQVKFLQFVIIVDCSRRCGQEFVIFVGPFMCCPVFFQLFCINKCVFTLYAFERHVFPLTDRFVSKQIPTLDGIETETESTKKTRFESQKVKVDIQLLPCSEWIKNS